MAIFVHRNESSIEISSTALRCERLRACSDIRSDAWSGRPYETQQPSFTVLLSRAIFMWSWIRLSLSIQHTSWALWFPICHVKELACFYEPKFSRKTSGKIVKLDLPSVRLVQPIRLFKPDRILICLLECALWVYRACWRHWCSLLELRFVLKIETNAWGI